MNYEEAYKESMKRASEFVKRGSLTIDFAKAIFDDFEMDEDEVIRKKIIKLVKKHSVNHERCMMTNWLNKQRSPKWLYRLEYKDGTCGLWYNGEGKWCFEQGIGLVEGCKTKDLPMDHDERYKQDGRDWFSSCSRKKDLMHWYSLEDAKKLIEKGFVFTRYLATEYHEYEQETVFIKDTALVREEIDIFELFGKPKLRFSKGDWVVKISDKSVHQIKNDVLDLTTLKYGYDLTDGVYISPTSVNEYRLWTSQDAKPGDVIAWKNTIMLFKAIDPKVNFLLGYCMYMGDSNLFICGNMKDVNMYYPATPEQSKTLFLEMHKAGYYWDAENFEVKEYEKYVQNEDNPKFKEGDWVVNRKTGTIHQVKNVVENVSNAKNAYDLMDGEYISTSEVENYHIWKIENDAIPGDVLAASDGSIFLYNGYEDKDKGARYFVSLTQFGEIEISNGTHYWENIRACHPSTKEERDLLFAKLKEAGYEWDGDKLRLINLKESDLDEESDWMKNFNAVLSYIKDKDLCKWLKKQLGKL